MNSTAAALPRVVKIVTAFVLFTVLIYLGKPTLLRPLFPAAALLAGYLIFRTSQIYFLSFYLWVSILAPLLRRLVDWRSAYQDQSMILLAPLVLALLPAIHLRRQMHTVPRVVRIVALLTLGAIFFGAGIGTIKHPDPHVLLALATWCAPIFVCVFAASLDSRPLRRTLTRTLASAVLLMSLYGIYQFIFAPPWDVYWLRQVTLTSVIPSFGQPLPFAIRVWSTMNSPGACAVMLSASLVWLFTQEGLFVFVAEMLGYVTLLLTLVRSAWLQTALAILLVLILFRSGAHVRRSLFKFVVLGTVAVVALRLPQSADILQRFSTLTSLKSDESYNERGDLYRYVGAVIAANPLGAGLDTVNDVHGYPLDSSILIILYMLGWPGAALYLSALLIVFIALMRSVGSRTNAPTAASYIVVATLFQSVSGDILYRQGGLVLWLFFGLWAGAAHDTGLPEALTPSPTQSPLQSSLTLPQLARTASHP